MRIRSLVRRGGLVTLAAVAALAGAAGFVVVAAAEAAPVRIFQVQSAVDFLRGTLDRVRLDPVGAIELGAKMDRIAGFDEPFALAVAAHPRGWIVGTGNAGKVLLVEPDGHVTVLFTAPEPEVFAVAVDGQGTIYAATSPRGKVYRLKEGGKPETLFTSGEDYVWALVVEPDGALLVATGTHGRLFRVHPDGKSERLLDGVDTHVRALLRRADGSLLIGTAGQGLLLERQVDGSVRTLVDPPQPEIAALVEGPAGSWYAAAVTSEASWVEPGARIAPAAPSPASPSADASPSGEPQVTVTVAAEGDAAAAPTPARPAAGKGPRSEIWRGDAAGRVERVDELAEDTVFALLWYADRLWVATGVEGRLFTLPGPRLVLERDLEERQIVAFAGGTRPAVLTTNGAALYRLGAGREASAVLTSPSLDAGQVARWGTLTWLGQSPVGTRVRFSLRSGGTADPDESWSAWSDPREGREIAVSAIRPGRYLQWRAELTGDGAATPRLVSVEVSYRQENLRPRVERFGAMEPGQILVPTGYNPAEQVFEPLHAARGGMFTTLRPVDSSGDGRVKPLFKLGYRTLRWKVDEPNGDPLEYELAFRPEGAERWLPMGEPTTDEYFSFDAAALPDGLYRFRLRASDRRGNPGEEPLVDERTSEPIVVDHTPPRRIATRREAGRVVVEVEDELSPLRTAEASVDGGEWRPAVACDGLLDGRHESLVVDVPAGARFVLLRVSDAQFNQVAFDLSEGSR
ncbi:MAG: hypothetical protein IPJ17_12885 [Holophagales bacterium]|nr:MAG: hypothetical protein IPJ17_12885 [Holophagales bacterium]